MASSKALSLSDFIIAAIEEACPEVNGRQVYMRGFARFTQYCEDQARKTAGLPLRRFTRPNTQKRPGKRPV